MGVLIFLKISSLQIPAKNAKNGALEIEIHFVKTRRHKHQTTNHDFVILVFSLFSYNNILRK